VPGEDRTLGAQVWISQNRSSAQALSSQDFASMPTGICS
jgi:hypothetical protein